MVACEMFANLRCPPTWQPVATGVEGQRPLSADGTSVAGIQAETESLPYDKRNRGSGLQKRNRTVPCEKCPLTINPC